MRGRDSSRWHLAWAEDWLPTLLLCVALFFFLWMFVSAEGLVQTAEAGHFVGAAGLDPVAEAGRYAYEWRHGMAGGWPLYVPGFFIVAIATVVWACERSLRSLALRGSIALALALLCAMVLAPLGTRWLIPEFQRDTGLVLTGSPLAAPGRATLPGILTVVSWAGLVVSIQISITRRSIRPLVAPFACYSVLAVIRPGDFGDLVGPWAEALWRGESIAIVSTALIPPVVAILFLYCWRFRADMVQPPVIAQRLINQRHHPRRSGVQ
jgi:hypothetical protein